jgi:hypothetical protein
MRFATPQLNLWVAALIWRMTNPPRSRLKAANPRLILLAIQPL